jgi:hypothetical protein
MAKVLPPKEQDPPAKEGGSHGSQGASIEWSARVNTVYLGADACGKRSNINHIFELLNGSTVGQGCHSGFLLG